MEMIIWGVFECFWGIFLLYVGFWDIVFVWVTEFIVGVGGGRGGGFVVGFIFIEVIGIIVIFI